MAKNKKKRTKRYAGADAAQGPKPVVRRYEAVMRGPVRQWLYDHRRQSKIFGVLALIVFVITLVVSALTGLL